MSKRTLPDELRSVLLAHALHAPDPDDTVHRVLAATVAPQLPRPAARRPRRFSVLTGSAAAVLVAVLAGVGFVVDQSWHPNSDAAKSNSAAQSNEGQSNGIGHNFPTQQAGGRAVTPPRANIAPGEAGGAPANPVPPSELNCARLLPGSRLAIGSAAKARLAGMNQDLYLYDFRCVKPDGTRSASTVAAYVRAGSAVQLRAVLVSASFGGKVDFLGSDDHRLVVQLLSRQQDLIRQDYTTTDGVHFSEDTAVVAAACTPADLTTQIVRVDSASPTDGERPYAVQFTKHSGGICVLSGFPSVTAADGSAASAVPTLRGAAGGTGARVPEIVELAQGTTVAAMIEPAARPGCAPGGTVAVSLPSGRSVGVLPADVALCGAQVHPIVANARGSD